jgi:hypothetical protein
LITLLQAISRTVNVAMEPSRVPQLWHI